MCMGFCLHVILCTMCMLGVSRGEIPCNSSYKTDVSCHVGVKNQTSIL